MAGRGGRRRKKRLAARARWCLRGGPEALQALADLGERPADEDLPPALSWEEGVWRLYIDWSSQRRAVFAGYAPVDMAAVAAEVARRGWRVEWVLDLLTAITSAEQEHWRSREESTR